MMDQTQAPTTQQTQNPTNQPIPETSEKDYLVAYFLSFFVGVFGVDRFYLGYIGTGILKLVTGGGFGIWHIVDVIRIAWNSLHDKQKGTLRGYNEHKKWTQILTIITFCFVFIILPILVLTVVLLAMPSLQKNAHDVQKKTDMSLVASDLSEYANQHQGSYPSKVHFSDGSFTPTVSSAKLTTDNVDYQPKPEGCDETTIRCRGFTLSTKLESGVTYSLSN